MCFPTKVFIVIHPKLSLMRFFLLALVLQTNLCFKSTLNCLRSKVKYFWEKRFGISNSYSWGEVSFRCQAILEDWYLIYFIHSIFFFAAKSFSFIKFLTGVIFLDLIFLWTFLNCCPFFLTFLEIGIYLSVETICCNNSSSFEILAISTNCV